MHVMYFCNILLILLIKDKDTAKSTKNTQKSIPDLWYPYVWNW
jgi:hypothetical protein